MKKKRFTILARLIVGFSAVLALSAITAVYAITTIATIGRSFNSLFFQGRTATDSCLLAQCELATIGSELKDILLADDLGQSVAAIQVSSANINAALDQLDISASHNADLIQKVRDSFGEFISMSTTGMELLKSGETEKGMAMVGGIRAAFAQTQTQLNELADTTAAHSTDVISRILSGTQLALKLLMGLFVLSLLFSIVIEIRTERHIVKPVRHLEEVAARLAVGELDTQITVYYDDELGDLAKSFEKMSLYIKTVIADINSLLDQMSMGNFDVSASAEYVGGYAAILNSLNQINSRLSDTLWQINAGAEQVAAGTEHVSQGAQALATGATEQASAVEELSSSIIEISAHIRETAHNAREADEITKRSSADISSGSRQMEQMIVSISEISDMSSEIGKIIKTIDDIAFQTNILALNAAVEAARAGEAGKGFAVVADEVRNLAQKSAGAAKNTTALIEGTVAAVDKGTRIADDTAKSLNTIIDTTHRVTELVAKIADASERQAEAVDQVTIGVSQISQVVQTNSATSEESAAASEELFSQAQMLRDLVAAFKLHETSRL